MVIPEDDDPLTPDELLLDDPDDELLASPEDEDEHGHRPIAMTSQLCESGKPRA
jgi:hypothetical protein